MTDETSKTLEAAPQAESESAAAEKPRRSMRRLRFETGLAVLFTAMGAMIALVLFDTFFAAKIGVEDSLISNAFEAFKLIAVTVLGYTFGANQAKPSTGE